MSTRTSRKREIEYPESDGKPMAETDVHRDEMFTSIHRLRDFFAGQQVYVSGNLLIYYEEGNRKKCVAPDTFVVKDCDPGRRRIFKIWEERRVPNCVLETTSKKTRRQDQGKKMELYAQLGVGEYILYDPLAEWLKPPLQGYRLVDGEYVRIEPAADGSILSQELGIRFKLENSQLEMYDAATGERLLTADERAAEGNRRAAEAEAELARLRAQLQAQKDGGRTTP